MVAFGSRVSVDWPFGPRTRRRIAYCTCYSLIQSGACDGLCFSWSGNAVLNVAPYAFIGKDGRLVSGMSLINGAADRFLGDAGNRRTAIINSM